MTTEPGTITYTVSRSVLHSWGPTDPILRAVVLAILVIVLSFQTTATVLDLSFGTKKPGSAYLRDIQLMLLARRQSPYAAARALLPRLPFSRLPHAKQELAWDYDGGPSLDDLDSAPRPSAPRLKPYVVVKLLIVICVAPVINVAAILLTLEYDSNLTFREVEFGGVALGVDLNSTRDGYVPLTQFCERAPVDFDREEQSLFDFVICDTTTGAPEAFSMPFASITVDSTSKVNVHVSFLVPFEQISYWSVAHLVGTDPQIQASQRMNFHVAHSVNDSNARVLANYAINRMQDFCGRIGEVEEDPSRVGFGKLTTLDSFVNLTVPCEREDNESSREAYAEIQRDVLSKVVFVPTDKLNVSIEGGVDNQDAIFTSVDDENFIRRRNTFADVFIILILAVLMVVVRAATRLLTRNDIPRGIGLIIRDRLKVPTCDSMLPSKEVVASFSGLAHLSLKHQPFQEKY